MSITRWGIAALILPLSWSSLAATPVQGSATPGSLYKVARQQLPATVRVSGRVTARKSVALTAQVPGRIEAIAGAESDRFSKGTVLIRLDDTTLKAKLEAAKAQRVAALAQVRNADAQLAREVHSPGSRPSGSAPGGMGMPAMFDQVMTNPMQNMMGMRHRGAERAADLTARETSVATARTKVAQANAQIKELEASLRDTRSEAPFDGRIELLHVEVGDTVQPGQPLLSFGDTGDLEIVADVPVRLGGGLAKGMSVWVRPDEAEKPAVALIKRVHPVADPRAHTVRIEVTLQSGTQATPGSYAELVLPDRRRARKTVLLVPNSAVVVKGGIPMVFAVTGQGKASLRLVRLGRQRGDDTVEVLAGVEDGDMIVRKPRPGLRSGDKVGPGKGA